MTPEPHRPLGRFGTVAWEGIWRGVDHQTASEPLAQLVLMVCEQIDERMQLRTGLIREPSWRDRAALRSLEMQIAANLALLIERTDSDAGSALSTFDDLLAALADPTQP